MPQVGKDKTTLELQRQRYLEDLEQKTKNRAYFKKAKQHLKDTGSSLLQPKETKSTLESLLDASKRDENLEKGLIKQLGSNSSQAKAFIQSLDESLKEFLLNRFEGFKKVFSENFTIPSSQNLKSAFEIFNRQEIEKLKDVDVPTTQIIRDYLQNFDRNGIRRIGEIIAKKGFPENNIETLNRLNTDFNSPQNPTDIVLRLIIRYLKKFKTEEDGYTALFLIMKQEGYSDFPRPVLIQRRAGVPTPNINAPIAPQAQFEPGIPDPDIEEFEPDPDAPEPSRIVDKVKGVDRFKQLFTLNNAQLKNLARQYNRDINPDDPITAITKKSKNTLAYDIIERGYNPRQDQFFRRNELNPAEKQRLINHMTNNYNLFPQQRAADLKFDVDPAIENIEGFGMMKIYKLGK